MLRHAVVDVKEASVRINVFPRSSSEEAAEGVDVLISLAPPRDDDTAPLRVRSAVYERYLPHLKHVGTFSLIDHARRARAASYDDALFIDPSGRISEGTIWNLILFDGRQVVWPDAPKLVGVTMQLVHEGLEQLGIAQCGRPVRLAELSTYTSAAITYSIGAGRLIRSIDDPDFTSDETLSRVVRQAYECHPYERSDRAVHERREMISF